MTNPIYVDASNASSTSQAVALNKSQVASPTNVTRADRFWSSNKSVISDPTSEVLEVDFASSSFVNRIAFDAVRFPQTIQIQYTQDNGQTWLNAADAVTGQPIVLSILESFPAVLPSLNAVSGHRHPQHDYDGHWQRHAYEIAAASIQKVRFVITRNPAGNAPVDATGSPVPYSVALQNIEVGYEIRSKNDIPRSVLMDDSKQTTQTFANSTDLFNSNLGFAKRTRYARNLIYNTDAYAPFVWKSEPQPFPDAVVNFYADLRDASGNPQTINRIFIDPLYEGPYINLYYSNQTSVTQFNSSRRALDNSEASLVNGSINLTSQRMQLGTFVDPTLLTIQATASMFATTDGTVPQAPTGVTVNFLPSYAQINNASISFDPSQDWWMGMSFLPTANMWRSNYDNIKHPLFSCSQFEIGYFTQTDTFVSYIDGGTVPVSTVTAIDVYAYFKTANGDMKTCLIYSDGVDNNISEIQIIAAYRNGNLRLDTQHHGQINTTELPASVPFTNVLPQTLLVGTDTLIDRFSNPSISAFILKQETLVDNSFVSNPTGYSYVNRFPGQTELGGQNALLRFDPTIISQTSPTGFVGGPAFTFENLTWTPIARSYAMHRGSLVLPATQARYWNLEITNLRPEINDKFVPVTRSVKTFPPQVISAYNDSKTGQDRQSYDDLGSIIQSQLAYSVSYQDIPRYTGTGADSSDFSNTEVYVADDPTNADRLSGLGSEWKYRQFHPDSTVPRFPSATQHIYTVQDVQQTSNVSFYCGLRNIQFQRTVNTVPQDHTIIEEEFLDSAGIDNTGNWVFDTTTAGISSGGSTFARTTSKTMPTQRAVNALQFAAQQSDAKPININGEFSSSTYNPTSLTSWSPFGDGKKLGLTQVNSATDVALLVSRQYQNGFYADIPINYSVDSVFSASFGNGSYGAITTYNPANYPSFVTTPGISTTYGQMSAGIQSSQYQGGIVSSAVAVPNGGRIYAAARVTATQALSQPLYVQIIDSDTGGVLAEQQSTVAKGTIQEWYASIDTSTFQQTLGVRWKDIQGAKTFPAFNDTFNRANSTTLGNMTPSGQAWSTTGTSLQISSNAAVCTATGQMSQFDAQTPWGTLQVTLPNLITAGGPFQLIDLGGVILRSDGQMYDTFTSAQVGSTVTLAAGHVYSFAFKLASQASGTTLDTAVFPFAIEIRDNGTLVQTVQRVTGFNTIRALYGGTNQQFDDLIWTPGVSQINNANAMVTLPIPDSTLQRTGTGNNTYIWSQPIPGAKYSDQARFRNWLLQGSYTYGTNGYCTNASSIAPGGTFLGAPTGLAVTVNNPTATLPSPSGFMSAQASMFDGPSVTYFWKVTATNAAGETIGSNEVSASVQNGGSATLTWNPVANATGYNVYRSTTTNTELYVGPAGNYNTFTDPLASNTGNAAIPTTDTSNANGTVMVAQMMDNFGSMVFNVTQMPSGLAASAVPIGYLNYNLSSGNTITLYGDGSIKDQNSNVLATIASFSATAGPIRVRYMNAQTLSSSFRSTWSIAGTDTQALIIIQGNTVKAVLHGTAVWDSTWRGVGGANDGTAGAGHYTIIEGPSWYPEGSTLLPAIATPTWGQETSGGTLRYSDIIGGNPPTTRNIAVRLVQKNPSSDFWFVQSVALFWDPIVWEFSSDDGTTWWKAIDVRNNPNSVLQFPPGLTDYGKLKWRVTSYSPDMHITHMAIRPWYAGAIAYGVLPRPTQLPLGPNLMPTDFFTRIENDPRWKAWSVPIPRWWWNAYLKTK